MLHRILEKIESMGWRVYRSSNGETSDTYIQRGPSDELRAGNHYSLCVRSPNPTDPVTVRTATVAYLKETGNFPLVEYEGLAMPFSCMDVRDNIIAIDGPPGKLRTTHPFKLGYEDFLRGLDYMGRWDE